MRWYISATAVREYMALAPMNDFDRAAVALEKLCETAHFVKAEPRAEIWRTGRPDRWELTVSLIDRAEGGRPQLVRVTRKGGGSSHGRRQGRRGGGRCRPY